MDFSFRVWLLWLFSSIVISTVKSLPEHLKVFGQFFVWSGVFDFSVSMDEVLHIGGVSI